MKAVAAECRILHAFKIVMHGRRLGAANKTSSSTAVCVGLT
jgi:hypothetical protein